MRVALIKPCMTDPTGSTTTSSISPHRLTFDIGPSWLSPSSNAPTLPGYTLGARMGQSYPLSESWRFALNGVFSYSNYFAERGNVNRIGLGLELGPEVTLAKNILDFGLYGWLQQAFYYSPDVSWPGPTGRASFDNTVVASLSIRPSLMWFGGFLTTSFEVAHDFGLSAPGATRYDSPLAYNPNRYSFTLSMDLLKSFYAARGGYTGVSDTLGEFMMGIQPSVLVEGGYTYSLNNPAETGGVASNPYRTNTPHHNRARINLVELALERTSTERSPFGFRLDVNLGQDPISFAPKSSLIEPVIGDRENPGTQYFALQQAYLAYRFPLMEGLTFQAGQFATIVGNEVTEAPLNTFLLPSRGLLNTLAEPFYHAGALLRGRFSETKNDHDEVESSTEGVLGVVNGWDSVLGHEGGPTVMMGFTHQVNTRFTYALNYLIGAQDRGAQGLFNFNALYKPDEQWNLGVNLDLGHGNNAETAAETAWFGLGLYQQYTPVQWFNLAAREEVFADPQGARTGISQNLLSFTGAANFLLPYGFGVGPEIRHDHSVGRDASAVAPFLSGNNPSDGNTTFTLRAFWKYPFNY